MNDEPNIESEPIINPRTPGMHRLQHLSISTLLIYIVVFDDSFTGFKSDSWEKYDR
jgi:hypothetical protein